MEVVGIWWLSSRMREVMTSETESERERKQHPLPNAVHRKSHRERANRRDWRHHVKYISGRRCIYLNVRKSRSPSVKGKWRRKGEWMAKWKGFFGKQSIRIKGLMLWKAGTCSTKTPPQGWRQVNTYDNRQLCYSCHKVCCEKKI